MPPSDYEKRIIAMFDSFCKTVIRNCGRNLKRAKRNADKHSIGEPVEFLLELLGHAAQSSHERIGATGRCTPTTSSMRASTTPPTGWSTTPTMP